MTERDFGEGESMEGDYLAGSAGYLASFEGTPEEHLADYVTSRKDLRAVLWKYLDKRQEIITRAMNKEYHIVGKVNPTGRTLMIGGATVLALAGAGGAVLLCKRLCKHRGIIHKIPKGKK